MPLENVHTLDNEKGKVESKENQNEKVQSDKKNYEKVFDEETKTKYEEQEEKDKEDADKMIEDIEWDDFEKVVKDYNNKEDEYTKNKEIKNTLIAFENTLNDQRAFANTLENNEDIIILLDIIQKNINSDNPNTKDIKEYLEKTNVLLEKKWYNNQNKSIEEITQEKQTITTIEKNNDITKDMQLLGKTQKIDKNNYIVTLNIPGRQITNNQQKNISNIEKKWFVVTYLGDDSGQITKLKITSQNS